MEVESKQSIIDHFISQSSECDNYAVAILQSRGEDEIKEKTVAAVLDLVKHNTHVLKYVCPDRDARMHIFDRIIEQARIFVDGGLPYVDWQAPRIAASLQFSKQ